MQGAGAWIGVINTNRIVGCKQQIRGWYVLGYKIKGLPKTHLGSLIFRMARKG